MYTKCFWHKWHTVHFVYFCPSGTYNQPKWNRDAEAEFRQTHIDGAVRFNIEKICDVTNPIPLMLPSVEQFEKDVGEVRSVDIQEVYKLSLLNQYMYMNIKNHNSLGCKRPSVKQSLNIRLLQSKCNFLLQNTTENNNGVL